MWTKLPCSSKPPSKTIACQWGLTGASQRRTASPQELTERLKAEHGGSAFYRSFRRFVEIALDHGEDELADLGEELSVMAEEHSQAFGQTERHESVWKMQ